MRAKVQKLYCKTCGRHFQSAYKNTKVTATLLHQITHLNNEGMGISGIARLTGLSKGHVVNMIRKLAAAICKPRLIETGQAYEADEMYTYIGHKVIPCYIMYAINRHSKQVIELIVGNRTKENLKRIISAIIDLHPKRIFTDRLNIYSGLIDNKIHSASAYRINHIERFNLTLRTHVKRLNRKTICYSKSREMLENCLKIYLWGRT